MTLMKIIPPMGRMVSESKRRLRAPLFLGRDVHELQVGRELRNTTYEQMAPGDVALKVQAPSSRRVAASRGEVNRFQVLRSFALGSPRPYSGVKSGASGLFPVRREHGQGEARGGQHLSALSALSVL